MTEELIIFILLLLGGVGISVGKANLLCRAFGMSKISGAGLSNFTASLSHIDMCDYDEFVKLDRGRLLSAKTHTIM